ncbi:type II secretion system protein GspL [Gammaproteobacteria bacterium]|nr:type II secretion system protein GspL [Gammaproteobacteria bacterium]
MREYRVGKLMALHITQLDQYSESESASRDALVVWVPSEKVVVHRIPQPTAPKRKWSALVPWLLEERLLQAVEDMHFVIVGDNIDGSLDVMVASKQDMQHWLEQLNNADIKNALLLPDFMALPWQAGSISVGQHEDSIIVRSDQYSGFAADPLIAWDLIARLVEASPELRLSLAMPVEQVPDSLQALSAAKTPTINWLTPRPEPAANLLVAEFRQLNKNKKPQLWLSTAALLVLSLGLLFGYLQVGNNTLEQEVEILSQQQERGFSVLFPGAVRVDNDIHLSVEQFLEQGFRQRESLDAPLMNLLAALDAIISACSCDVLSIVLNEQGGELLLAQGEETGKQIQEQLQLGAFALSGYELEIKPQAESQNILLAINQVERL